MICVGWLREGIHCFHHMPALVQPHMEKKKRLYKALWIGWIPEPESCWMQCSSLQNSSCSCGNEWVWISLIQPRTAASVGESSGFSRLQKNHCIKLWSDWCVVNRFYCLLFNIYHASHWAERRQWPLPQRNVPPWAGASIPHWLTRPGAPSALRRPNCGVLLQHEASLQIHVMLPHSRPPAWCGLQSFLAVTAWDHRVRFLPLENL